MWVSAFQAISPNALTPTGPTAYNTRNRLVSHVFLGRSFMLPYRAFPIRIVRLC
jgi:hypothetical protein